MKHYNLSAAMVSKATRRVGQMLLLMAVVAASVQVDARPVNRQTARQQAQQFLMERGDARLLQEVTNVKRLAPGRRASVQDIEPYYIFDRGQNEGFVIVSGDDQTIPVLGYTESGTFDYDQLPPGLQDLLGDYARQLEAIQKGAPVAKLPANHPKVEPMLTCKWSQGSPYNNTCPMDGNSRSVTGCVATAMAQILYYHRERMTDETMAAIPAFTTWTKKIQVPAIAKGAPIDWANMKDTYGSANDLQRLAVANLMLYCGTSVKMDYTNSSSGAQSGDVVAAMRNVFGCTGATMKDYGSVTSDDEWDRIVYQELAAGRPTYLSGANASAGHAFVAHGYENQRYYINWGWGGQSDGLYYLSNLTPGDGQGIGGSDDGYNGWKQFVVGIEPDNFAEKAMTFTDSRVKTICQQRWDANSDGKLTYAEAAAVTDLGTAFQGETIQNFAELSFFTSLTALSDDAFNGCSQLANIRLPKNLKTIGQRAFKDCEKLRQLNLPTGVTSIGNEAFAGCTLLSSFELPTGITAIADGTFRGCASITAIDLPISVSSIGSEAFAGCTRLNSFTVHTYHPQAITLGSSVFDNADLSKAKLQVMQGTKAFFEQADQWSAFGTIVQLRDISGGKFVAFESGKTYYLYNVGTGRYLTMGEAYGRQAIVGETPMRFRAVHPASKADNVIYFSTPDVTAGTRYLFRTAADNNVGQGVKATFTDGSALSNSCYWALSAVGEQIYTLQVPAGDASRVEGEYFGVQTDHKSGAASPTYGAYYDVDYAAHSLNCQWQFVLYDEAETQRFNEAETLARLLATAKKNNVKYATEQAVYDDLESTTEQLLAAQSSLRKKLGFIEFYHPQVRQAVISNFDADTDGEISYKEASDVKDFGYVFSFMNNTSLVRFDELQYFTNAAFLPGNFLEGCTNLESVVLPQGLEGIYYRAFYNCKKLKAVNIPEYVTTIGDNAFYGCSALREVTVLSPDPATIALASNAFTGVTLSQATLYVPFGAKALYAQAPVWKNFGTIKEVRGSALPKFSPVEANATGYLYNLGTRKFLTMGEAYGTQSVVARSGRLYQLKHTANMGEGVYYLQDNTTGKVVFRTTKDSKVGEGVAACFGDGSLSVKAYWQLASLSDSTFTLQAPAGSEDYVAGHYLGVDESHLSDAASPTYGIYWDLTSPATSPKQQWAFVSAADLENAVKTDKVVKSLKEMIAKAKSQQLDVTAEQAVYDSAASTLDDLHMALVSVREKLHLITFNDDKTRDLCLANWDADEDGELSFEEAQAVTEIGELFRGSAVGDFSELRYFTSLTEIPANAFRNALSLQSITLPPSVTAIGEWAFTGCSRLLYLVLLNADAVVPRASSALQNQTTLFVPAAQLANYQADASWNGFTITEHTGKPVVTAEATRAYGRTTGVVKVKVLGAPVSGTPVATCPSLSDAKLPVGNYPIIVARGTVVTPAVELREGVLTITPAALTVTAKSYTRKVGEANPDFELTYKGFRNKETDTVFTVRPIVSCEATVESPAGEYEIVVGGAEALNYSMTYVSGKLTVEPATNGIEEVKAAAAPRRVYDLQGRRLADAHRRGLLIVDGKKVVNR